MWSSKEVASWIAGISSVADDSAAPFLRRALALGLWTRRELGFCLLAKQMRATGRADFRPQVSLDSARVSVGISDGGHAVGLSHCHLSGRLVGTSQPAPRRTSNPQSGSVCMKALLTLVLLLGVALPAAAQDTTKAAAPPAPPPAPAAAPSTATVEAVLARSVADRAPQDTGTAFPDSVGTVVLWMRVTGGGGQTLHHVWFHGGDEALALRRGLDSLRDHNEAEMLRQVNDRAHDLDISAARTHAVHEGPVDLDALQGEARQIAQGRVARAEIVHV